MFPDASAVSVVWTGDLIFSLALPKVVNLSVAGCNTHCHLLWIPAVDPNFLATLVSIARDFEVQIFARSSSVFHFDFEEDCFEGVFSCPCLSANPVGTIVLMQCESSLLTDFSKRMKLVVKLLVQLSHKAEELKLDSMAEVLVLGRVLIEELDRRQLEASNVESSLKRLVSHIQENGEGFPLPQAQAQSPSFVRRYESEMVALHSQKICLHVFFLQLLCPLCCW